VPAVLAALAPRRNCSLLACGKADAPVGYFYDYFGSALFYG